MTEQKRQEEFIKRITDQIRDRERAIAVDDEMRDHLKAAVADYLEMGMGEDEAGAKARKQMGDPAALGYALEKAAPKKWTKWNVVIAGLLALQASVAIRFVIAFFSRPGLSWLDFAVVSLMISVSVFLVGLNLRPVSCKSQPIMVIRANERLASMDQVTYGILLFGLILILTGTIGSFFGGEELTIPIMNSLFLATNGIVIWTGQRAGSAVYAEGLQPSRGRMLKWSEFKSYRILVSHSKKGKLYQLKLYGGKVEPIIGIEASQLKTVETLLSQYLVHA